MERQIRTAYFRDAKTNNAGALVYATFIDEPLAAEVLKDHSYTGIRLTSEAANNEAQKNGVDIIATDATGKPITIDMKYIHDKVKFTPKYDTMFYGFFVHPKESVLKLYLVKSEDLPEDVATNGITVDYIINKHYAVYSTNPMQCMFYHDTRCRKSSRDYGVVRDETYAGGDPEKLKAMIERTLISNNTREKIEHYFNYNIKYIIK